MQVVVHHVMSWEILAGMISRYLPFGFLLSEFHDKPSLTTEAVL